MVSPAANEMSSGSLAMYGCDARTATRSLDDALMGASEGRTKDLTEVGCCCMISLLVVVVVVTVVVGVTSLRGKALELSGMLVCRCGEGGRSGPVRWPTGCVWYTWRRLCGFNPGCDVPRVDGVGVCVCVLEDVCGSSASTFRPNTET